MNIAIERIDWLVEEIAKINRSPLEDIKFYKDGELVDVPQKIVDDFSFIGFNNVDFITTGFYKTGCEVEGK